MRLKSVVLPRLFRGHRRDQIRWLQEFFTQKRKGAREARPRRIELFASLRLCVIRSFFCVVLRLRHFSAPDLSAILRPLAIHRSSDRNRRVRRGRREKRSPLRPLRSRRFILCLRKRTDEGKKIWGKKMKRDDADYENFSRKGAKVPGKQDRDGLNSLRLCVIRSFFCVVLRLRHFSAPDLSAILRPLAIHRSSFACEIQTDEGKKIWGRKMKRNRRRVVTPGSRRPRRAPR